jgi:predicted nuclease of predicted toxin-antitoxin system
VKVVVDMNLSPEWVGFLEREGFEAVHWANLGDPRASDEYILRWAHDNDAVVFTNDLDFGRLLALTASTGPSVLQVRAEDLLPESIGADVVEALRDQEDLLRQGALIVIDETSSRVRILPLPR